MTTHFESLPPAETFRAIANWAQLAADAVEKGEPAVHWAAFIWAAVALGHPEARQMLQAGLDRTQRVVGPWGADKVLTEEILRDLRQ